jgi:hypothetical protein
MRKGDVLLVDAEMVPLLWWKGGRGLPECRAQYETRRLPCLIRSHRDKWLVDCAI